MARTMVARKGNTLGALTAQSIAVAMMLAALLVLVSSFAGPGATERLNAADLVVRTNTARTLGLAPDEVPADVTFRLPAGIAERVATVPGVDHVVVDMTFYAQVIGDDGRLVDVSDRATPRGQPWQSSELAPFSLSDGRPPGVDNEIVVDDAIADEEGLSVGDEVLVATNEPPARYRITGIASPGLLPRQASVFFSAGRAARLAHIDPGEADLLGVFLTTGAEAATVRRDIEAALDDPNIDVLIGQERAKADVSAGADQLLELGIVLGVMAGFVGFVAIFVLASTFAFSIQQRHREIGLQRAVGFTPGQIKISITLEALLISMLGSTIGALTGYALSRVLIWVLVHRGLAPDGFRVTMSWVVLVSVAAASIAIAQLAAFGAGRRASRIRPIEAMRLAGAPPRRLGVARILIGSAVLAGGGVSLAISVALPSDAAVAMSFLTTTCLTVGSAMLGPLIVIPPLWVFGSMIGKLGGTTGQLADTTSRRMPARVASIVSPIMLSIAFASLMICFDATLQTATAQVTAERMKADLYVLPAGEGLPLAIEPLIASVDGVTSVDAQLPVTTLHRAGDETYDVEALGVDVDRLTSFLRLEFDSGGAVDLDRGSVFLSRLGAESFGAETGSTITVTMADLESVEVRVAGIFENSLGTADMLIARDTILDHVRDPLTDTILVNLEDGADPLVVSQRIAAIGALGYPLQVVSHDEYVAAVHQSVADDSWAIYLIIGSASLLAGLAVVNTLAMSIFERSRELSLLRLVGATSRQVVGTVLKEAWLVIGAGLLFGWTIGIVSAFSVSLGSVGDLSALTVPVRYLLAIGAVASAVVVVSSLLPVTLVLRMDPSRGMGLKD